MLSLVQTVSRNRELLKNFVARDLKIKYRGTVAGYLWSLLEPLSLVAIYYFVFVVIRGVDDPNYPVVVLLDGTIVEPKLSERPPRTHRAP